MTEVTLDELIKQAFELRLTPNETCARIRLHFPKAPIGEVEAAFQRRLDEIAWLKAEADAWHKAEHERLDRAMGLDRLPPEVRAAVTAVNSYMDVPLDHHDNTCDGTNPPCVWEHWITILEYLAAEPEEPPCIS
jgi:hypothetical protein